MPRMIPFEMGILPVVFSLLAAAAAPPSSRYEDLVSFGRLARF
jgi:hypothetical protein